MSLVLFGTMGWRSVGPDNVPMSAAGMFSIWWCQGTLAAGKASGRAGREAAQRKQSNRVSVRACVFTPANGLTSVKVLLLSRDK